MRLQEALRPQLGDSQSRLKPFLRGALEAFEKIRRVLADRVNRISTFENNKRWQTQRADALTHRDVVLCQNLEIGYRVAGKGIEPH